MGKSRVIVVACSGEAPARAALERDLADEGVELRFSRDAAQVLQTLDECAAELLIVDLPEHEKSLALLRVVQERWHDLPVVLLTDELDEPQIAQAIALGASELLARPPGAKQLCLAARKAAASATRSRQSAPPPHPRSSIVFGRSGPMQAMRELLERVAPTGSTVLVRGESGTGKELVARAVHRQSPRARAPFIKIDCTSLPENLLESELFGYEKGAFTGAQAQKLGRVQLAEGGTLFLDEVGELSAPVQAKLLRLLQDREIERLGGKETIAVDVRVVAATHRDLETMVRQGEFREDLFYRLNVIPIWIAPLRARRVDIAELAQHFCAQQAQATGKPAVELSEAALRALTSQRWPGNVRQLENFVERLVVLCRSSSISEADVAAELARPVRFVTETATVGADAAGSPAGDGPLPLDGALRAAERQALLRAIEQTPGNRSAAARLLGVSRSTLYLKLEEHGLL